MKHVSGIDYAMDMLKVLAENEYSLLWDLVDDFEINGHVVSIKDSKRLNHIIIDNAYHSIGGLGYVMVGDAIYDPLDYVEMILSKKKEVTA